MLVFDIKPDEFEYAFSFDGPYEPAKGLLFNEENVLLDPYSRAVTGQRKWGEKPEGGKDFEYRARVVKSISPAPRVRMRAAPGSRMLTNCRIGSPSARRI